MQSSLPQDLVPMGSSTLLAIISTSCAIFMAIGQAVFNQRLKSNLGTMVSQDVLNEIAKYGVTNVRSLVSASELPGVIQEYSKAVTQVWVNTLSTFVCTKTDLGCPKDTRADHLRTSTFRLLPRPFLSYCFLAASGYPRRANSLRQR